MISTKEKLIDDRNIMVTSYPGRRALTNKTRLIKLLGSSVARLFSSDEPEFEMLGTAIDILVEKISPDELTKFMLELLCSTRIDGKEITETTFDNEFSGNLPLMYKILWFTLEVNYGNFFAEGGIGKILSKLKGTVPPDVSKKSMSA